MLGLGEIKKSRQINQSRHMNESRQINQSRDITESGQVCDALNNPGGAILGILDSVSVRFWKSVVLYTPLRPVNGNITGKLTSYFFKLFLPLCQLDQSLMKVGKLIDVCIRAVTTKEWVVVLQTKPDCGYPVIFSKKSAYDLGSKF